MVAAAPHKHTEPILTPEDGFPARFAPQSPWTPPHPPVVFADSNRHRTQRPSIPNILFPPDLSPLPLAPTGEERGVRGNRNSEKVGRSFSPELIYRSCSCPESNGDPRPGVSYQVWSDPRRLGGRSAVVGIGRRDLLVSCRQGRLGSVPFGMHEHDMTLTPG